MSPKIKLEEIISLHSIIKSAWLRYEWLDDAQAEAETKYHEVVERQQQLMHELAKWAVLEGIAGADDHLPMLDPVAFGITMSRLLEKNNETKSRGQNLP